MQYIKIIKSCRFIDKISRIQYKKEIFMPDKLYHEEFRINPVPLDESVDKIRIHCAFHSCWKPGFVGKSSGGKYAIYALVKSGVSCVTQGNRDYITRGVCFSFSRPTQPYQRAESIGPEDLVRKAVMVHQNAFHEMLSSHFFPVRRASLPLTQPDRVEKILDLIYDELGKKLPDDALLSGLFLQMLQEVNNQQRVDIYPETLKRVLEFIVGHLNDPDLSREKIAEECGISVRTLSRMFRRDLNIPVTQYIIQRRLELVCGMLSLPRLTIKEIASRCGFQNAGFLTNQFRQHYRQTPKEYRRRLFSGEFQNMA